jgi:prevent-host-death family protein
VDNKSVGLRELGQNVFGVLGRIKRGETIVVTEHGHSVARIVPYGSEDTLDAMVADGRVIPPIRDFGDVLSGPRLPAGKSTLSEILEEMRRDER